MCLCVAVAMADWQEIVQTVIIGIVFAYMVTKLYSLIASFRDENLRVERGVTTSLLATSDTEELAPADEQNVPLSTPAEEELEADGEDEQEDEGRVRDSSSSDSESEDDTQQLEDIHSTDEGALPGVASGEKDEEVVVKEEEASKDVETDAAKGDSVDRVTSLGEHSLKALVCCLTYLPTYGIHHIL